MVETAGENTAGCEEKDSPHCPIAEVNLATAGEIFAKCRRIEKRYEMCVALGLEAVGLYPCPRCVAKVVLDQKRNSRKKT